MANGFQVAGKNAAAPFTLRVHRGEGMVLLAMDWRNGPPPDDFVGFAIEYREPGGRRWYPLTNRLSFSGADDEGQATRSTLRAPIQKFRWVHFPRNAELTGDFTYRVTPVFMNDLDVLSYGEVQTVALELRRETYPGKMNVAFTRGFVSSQAFVDRFAVHGKISTLLPGTADRGLDFVPSHPDAGVALPWMGFEARDAVLELLDQAIKHPTATVLVVAYDLNEPELVRRLEALGPRLRIIVDDSDAHGKKKSAETVAAQRLLATAGANQVKRQHMGGLQHNKTIVVDGTGLQKVLCGSTNFSWRGFFVQNNNAVVLTGTSAVKRFRAAFEQYWKSDKVAVFGASPLAKWEPLGVAGIKAKVAFSPHSSANAVLASIAEDIEKHATSSVFYSLAFLAQTTGAVRKALKKVTADPKVFVYGMADARVGELDLQTPDGNVAPVHPVALTNRVPEPFKSEPAGGSGIRMHHKFVVIDFDQPTARVYLGSYNFSTPADVANGENLLLVEDRRVAVAYMVEAVRIFDHYQFRVKHETAAAAGTKLALRKPPRAPGETPWWKAHYTDPVRIRDRKLFA